MPLGGHGRYFPSRKSFAEYLDTHPTIKAKENTSGATRRPDVRHAREGQQVLGVGIRVLDPGEAVLKQAAIQVPPHLLVDKTPPETVTAFEALLPLPPHLVVHRIEKAVQGCSARVPRPKQASRLCGQDDSPCLPQRGGTSPACPHIDQRARISPHLPAWSMSSAGPDLPQPRRITASPASAGSEMAAESPVAPTYSPPADRPAVARPRWSPTGDHVAFIANAGSEEEPVRQVFALPIDGGEARVITSAASSVVAYEWSADGNEIFYVAADAAEEEPDKKRLLLN